MSHIPNAAMPHAGGGTEELEREDGSSPTLKERAGKIAEHARAHPKTAAAAGAAVIAGVAAAAAIPLVRSRKGSASKGSSKGGSARAKKSS